MKIIKSKNRLLKLIYNENNLGFVPTMGAIHEGHLSLIKKSNTLCNKTIVTIFINKPQFNKKNDFKKYPRRIKKDISILKKAKINFLYIPKQKEIYSTPPKKNIKINNFEKKLCGKHRKGHFVAIVDVIDRFLNIIKPKKIFLGQKDMQQLKIIDDFLKKKHKSVSLIECKTIREKNGVAMSSRNILLNINQKKIASNIYHFLLNNKKKITKKIYSLKGITKKILELGATKIDYVEILDINRIVRPYNKKKKLRIFVAYYLKSTRLIDNI
jgi:pantoate--beta-alanine ligase